MLDWFATDIRYQQSELSYSIKKAANMEVFEGLGFLKDCSKLLANNPFPIAWKRAVENWKGHLDGDDKELVSSLGNILGAADVSGQLSSISCIRNQLDKSLKEAEKTCAVKGKLARSLGVLIGLAIGIVMM